MEIQALPGVTCAGCSGPLHNDERYARMSQALPSKYPMAASIQGRGVCNSAHVGPSAMTKQQKWPFGPSQAKLLMYTYKRCCTLLYYILQFVAGTTFQGASVAGPKLQFPGSRDHQRR